MSKYTTGELAKLCGVTVRTVQYYDTRGILIPSDLSEGGRRLYSDDDLKHMKVICFLREMDLPIDAISQILNEEHPEKVISLLIEQQVVGFPEKTADIRMAQYESGSRSPKAELTETLAGALGVSPSALSVPDIDSYIGLMHTLFTLEDRYGLHIDEADGEICLKVDVRKNKDAAQLHEMLCAWRQAAAMLKAGEITQEEYDRWRYRYPEFDTTQRWVKVPSQKLSDMLVEALKNPEE